MSKTYYVTTPIYYPNANPHIGHTYTTVAADTIARYKKMRGFEVKFLTGTDEHGQKLERAAAEKGVTPQAYVDEIAERFKSLWKLMNVEYDIFIRTTDDYHQRAVQKIFKKLYEQDDIYKSAYQGHYCTSCETFYTEHQLKDGCCPDCGGKVELVKEEAYFFRLSKYQDRLMELLGEGSDFLLPPSRRNEMINNFLKPGLEDLCVSRTSFKWGIPVDFDPGHVVYVWIDALSNYITALGFMSDDDSDYRKFWPADHHLMAKEIVRFHSLIWPAILMALGEPLPKHVYGHGWIMFGGGKMSKSKGNVVDPVVLCERYGVDAVRYFLMREMSFGQDGNFSNEALIQRINSDLANDLGNLLSRTVAMVDKYFAGKLQAEQAPSEFDAELQGVAKIVYAKAEGYIENLCFNDALSEIWTLIRRANKYIDENMPWVLAKDESQRPLLANTLYNLMEVLRITAVMISPFMPNTSVEMFKQLGINDGALKTWDSAGEFGSLPREAQVVKGGIIFPRIDMVKELEELETMNMAVAANTKQAAEKKEDKTEEAKPEIPEYITIDDFAKVQLKVGKVLECKMAEGSDKLLVSQIKTGDEVRQIVSGIRKYYSPEEMVGKTVIVVTNLKPVKLRGNISEGMILAAEDAQGNLALVTLDKELEPGSGVR